MHSDAAGPGLNILLIQECGRHEANRNFREALSFQRAFTKLGHTATVWGLGYDNFAAPFEEISKGADVVFLVEQYDQTGWVPDFSQCGKLKVHWSVDDHCNIEEHLKVVERQQIDIHLSATKLYLDYYNRTGMVKYWLPNAYDDELVGLRNVPRHIRLGFVGNRVNRGQWIQILQQDMGLDFREMLLGEDMVQFINCCMIHWNRNMEADINYRTFETLGCGTFLLTNRTPQLEHLFDIGHELVVYGGIEDLQNKIRYYWAHPDERQAIEAAGLARVKRDHTYLERARRVVEICNG